MPHYSQSRPALGENARMAFRTLREHKVRSALTVLGVVIGVTAIVGVGSVLMGMDRDIRGFFAEFGTNTLFVSRWNMGIQTGRRSAEERQRKPLTLEDAQAIMESCPAVKNVAVELFPRFGAGPRGPVNARYKGNEVDDVQHYGVSPSWEQVFNADIAKGRFFLDGENLHRMDVAVIGYDLQDGLFPGEDPIGKTILVGGVSYRVVGVMAKRKGQFLGDASGDKMVLVPYYSYKNHHPQYDEHVFGAEAYPGLKSQAEDEIRGLLRRRRRVPFNQPDNFDVQSAEAMATQFREIMGSVALVTIAVASIGLLVGGVGVMNIMLMSVTERTREIGVRKAIGARQRDIVGQFLIEAVTLTGAGGVIGVLLGLLISVAINLFLPTLPSVVPAWAVILGVGMGMSVGLFFGVYPAMKAARLDPVDALRYE